ncbi:hypothetical protein BC629DRAFT_1476774 [Irpex lacteus]|nr:hypothetical protein BC629DRAFT_1476774 [Irpex lacteus]
MTKPKYGKKTLAIHVVQNTWTGLLKDEKNLPPEWARTEFLMGSTHTSCVRAFFSTLPFWSEGWNPARYSGWNVESTLLTACHQRIARHSSKNKIKNKPTESQYYGRSRTLRDFGLA